MATGGGGLERPSHCQFGPDGALYVVDYGQLTLAPEKGGVRMVEGTGTVWRIRRTTGDRGEIPPRPIVVPLNASRLLPAAVVALALAGVIALIVRRVL